MKRSLVIAILAILYQVAFSQDIRIYHGENSGSVFLKQNDKLENSGKESVKIVRAVNGVVTINILNPNPFFYNYEINTEDVDIKDDYSDQFADLVKLINALPDFATPASNPFTQRAIPRALAPAAQTTLDQYEGLITQLNSEIIRVKGYISTSDHAESPEEALKRIGNSAGFGFRAAIAKIQTESNATGHFNSKTLEKDLNDALDKAISDGSFATSFNIAGNATLITLFKGAFKGLNNQMATAVAKILAVTKKETVLRFQVPVKENKQTNIKIIVTKINNDDNVVRDLLSDDVATVLPLYVRKRFEVVPVVNLIFQSNRKKFSVENDLVQSNPDDDAKFNIGAMALMNFASFGEFKEYGVGLGIGYSMQPDGKASSFFAIPSLSYKNIFRLGFGFGYNLSPVGLKNGAAVGSPLPANISNIEDVIDYKRKPAAVLTLTIAGIKF